jgi:hypothetical protein
MSSLARWLLRCSMLAHLSCVSCWALCLLGTSSAEGQLVRIGPDHVAGFDEDDPIDPLIMLPFHVFDGGPDVDLGPTGPTYTLTTTDMGVVSVFTGSLFVGQSHILAEEEIGGDPFFQYAMVDTSPSSPLTFSSALMAGPFSDPSSPTAPVLASSFLSSISLKFSSPVSFVLLKAGYFDDVGSTVLDAYGADGSLLGTTMSTTEGFEYFGLANAAGDSTIYGISLYHPAAIPGIDKFGVDNVIFGTSALLIGTADLSVATDTAAAVDAPGSTSLEFSTTRVGSVRIGHVIIENTGVLGPLPVTFGVPTGGDADQFGQSGITSFLDTGETASDFYQFRPTTIGSKTSTATVMSDVGDVTVTLSGTADTPVLGFDGDAYDAGPATFATATVEGPVQELPLIDYGQGEFSSSRTFFVDNASMSTDWRASRR